MAIKLGQRPKTFKPFSVKFPMPDGETGVIQATYKYRTRVEFGKLMNEVFGGVEDRATEGKVDFEKIFESMGDKNADYLLECLDSWNLTEPLTKQTLLQLSSEIPAASVALMTSYREACVDGKLGN
jgi:hypothetical protein